MNSSIRSIVHPTDFSDLSAAAVAHAWRIALATRSKLHLVHVSQYDAHEALAFPQARRLLVQWGLSAEDDPPSVVADKLGIEVDNIRLALQEPTRAIVDFLSQHASDLVVLATHGRDGVDHWRFRRCSSRREHAGSSVRSTAISNSAACSSRSTSLRGRAGRWRPCTGSAR